MIRIQAEMRLRVISLYGSKTAQICLLLVRLTLPVLLFAPYTLAQHQPDKREADPARPTVTNPAYIPPAGYLQFEQGLLVAADSPVDPNTRFDLQTSIVQATKIAVNKRLLFIALSQPYAHTSFSNSNPGNGSGDVQFVGQVVLFDFNHGHGTIPSLSASYMRRVYAGAAPSLDVGDSSQGVTLLTGGNIHKLHYDANLVFNEQNDSRRARRAQYGETLLLSYNPTEKLTLNGEIWHFTQPVLRGNAVGICTQSPILFDQTSCSMPASTMGSPQAPRSGRASGV